jgi:hypothetical protein
MSCQSFKVELVLCHTGCHDDGSTSASAIGVWDSYAVHVGFMYVLKLAEHICNFVGGNIFRLPSECVTQPINKEDTAVLISSHDIAASEPPA